MTIMQEKLTKAIEESNLKNYTWKFAKTSNNQQDEIKLMNATPEQLQTFYNHCQSMLYSNSKNNLGRYNVLKLIEEQRNKCNIELFLRKLENGTICADHKSYPRILYLQDIRAYMNANKENFPKDQLKEIPISACTSGLPREFERLSIEDVIDGCLDGLGILSCKHITYSFILNLGVYLNPTELNELKNDKRKKPEIIKDKLGIKQNMNISIKHNGLTFNEMKAMLSLKTKKYSDLTTDQLNVLLKKVFFRLENEVQAHIDQWNMRIQQILKVAEVRGIEIKK